MYFILLNALLMNRTIFFLFFFFITVNTFGQDLCWYYLGQKVCFEVSKTKLLVNSEKLDINEIKNLIEKTNVSELKEIADLGSLFYLTMQKESMDDILKLKRELSANEDVIYVSLVFWDGRMIEGSSYTNKISIKLKSKDDYPVLKKCAEDYQITDIKINEYNELWYALTLPHNPLKNAIDTANELYETGLFMVSEPDVTTLWPTGNEPLLKEGGSNIIYPNPVNDIININLDNIERNQNNSLAFYNIILYNSQGNILRQTKAKDGIVQFNVSNFPNGIYFIQIYDGISTATETIKIFVKH